jgi:tripartite-type tricarboxylate transporter receptor subunit TctC
MGWLFRVIVLAVMFVGTSGASAQDFPTRPITIIVPFAAGGPTDTIARILAERMRVSLGQTVLIENVTGASGSIGGARVARAAPDGYTLAIGHWSTHVLNGAILSLPYDVIADFEPIGLVATGPQLIIGKKNLPAKTLAELVAWLKDSAGKASAGTAGPGTGSHVAAVFFQNKTGTQFQFVPYRGAGPALNDLVAGHIDLMFDQASNSLNQVRAGTVKAFAVTAKTRLASAPEIPTVDEAGLPELYIDYWHGLWAPKRTPKEVVAKLNTALRDALADQTVRSRLADLGQEFPAVDRQTPDALAQHQKAEADKWWPIIKAANIKAD